MIDLDALTDEELATLAAQWRTRALHGDANANGRAHELERELRRRLGTQPSLITRPMDLEDAPARRRPWWAFWR